MNTILKYFVYTIRGPADGDAAVQMFRENKDTIYRKRVSIT